MRSIATTLRRGGNEFRGRSSFRAALVIALVLLQGTEVSGVVAPWVARLWMLPMLCFAGLATSLGFSAGWQRRTLSWREIAGERLRLGLPVYGFAVLAAVLVLGPVLANDGARAYFRNLGTYAYFLNLVGIPQYRLPGIFEFNTVAEIVNPVVWVLPIGVGLLVFACMSVRRRVVALLPALAALAIALAAMVAQGLDLNLSQSTDFPMLLLQGDGLSVALGGLIGIAASRSAERIPLNAGVAWVAALLLAAAAVLGNPGWSASAAFRVVASIPVAYCSLVLTIRPLPLASLTRRIEPYLAGLFLFAFPVQQIIAQLNQDRQGSIILDTIVAGMIALMVAAAFWHLVGRRLVPMHMREALAPAPFVDRPTLADFRRWSFARRDGLAQSAVIVLILGGIFIGVMGLLYIAMLPEAM